MSQNLYHLGAAELARRIARGDLSSRELLETLLARVERFNPELNAIVVLRADAARQRADEADRARARGQSWGPLHGVPMTVKECFDWADTPSTFGHPERRDHRATEDAVALARLKQAGAIVLGKTNVPKDLSDWQSVNALYGLTRNPWNLEHSPGGSSGGSAAALAAGLSALEIGSDVGGSIRMPSHFCGTYGHRPTFGIVPVRGHATTPDMPPDDINAVGPLARTAEDLELGLKLMAGPEGRMSRAWRLELPAARKTALKDFRVAVIANDAEFPVDSDTREAALTVASVLERAGAQVTLDAALPIPSRDYYELYIALLRASTSYRRPLAEIAALQPGAAAMSPDDHGYEALMLRGLTQTHRDWHERNAERYRLRARWETFFGQYDAVITPVSPTPAFPHIRDIPKAEQKLMVDGQARPNADTYFWIGIAAAAYLPVTTIPAGQSKSGLPIGLQIIGPEYGDLTCIALARQLETAHRGFRAPPGFS
jgi:amidase